MACNRRRFLRVASWGALMAHVPGPNPLAASQRPGRPRPSAAQLRWQNAEFGVIFHFDIPIAARAHAPNNSTRQTFDPNSYAPDQLDTDQWLAAAKAAGARYAVFTATHFNGFLQWQSDAYPYGLRQSRWRNGKADVVRDFVDSCRRAGLEPGLYLSTHRNAYWTVWGHYVDWGRGRGSPRQAEFNRVAERMTLELCSNYGPLLQIWYDAGVKTPAEGGPDVLPIFEKYQPDSIFYSSRDRADYRWIGNEDGVAGRPCWASMPGRGRGGVSHNAPAWKPRLAGGDPAGTVWAPAMCDTVLRGVRPVHDWFWAPNHEHAIRSVPDLVDIYEKSVGRNANLVLGVVIDPHGRVPEPDARRLAEFGRALQPYRRFLAETSGHGPEVRLELQRPGHGPLPRINAAWIMEDIRQGERIRTFTLEAEMPGGDRRILETGRSVGHARLVRFPEITPVALNLRVHRAEGRPHIRRLAAVRV